MLFMALPVIPVIGSIILLLSKRTGKYIPFLSSLAVLLVSVWGSTEVISDEPLMINPASFGPFSPVFRVDALSGIFILLSALVWTVVCFYAPCYMQHEGREKGFYLCLMLTFSAVLGVFMAGDLITLLLFFELVTITSFFFVIHRQNKEAFRAGYFYLFFSIAGGLLIAIGIALLISQGHPLLVGSSVLEASTPLVSWGILAILLGFGVKAGMAPLHLWLPHAHSVAPTPGSALLSGIIIKVGAYGLIRTGQIAGWGVDLGLGLEWLPTVLTVLGISTMLIGVLAALLQSDAKRLLAYHSVSQMGYIILGIGIGLFLGSEGVLGFLGAVYHVVNHALFKAALFLGVGVIYFYTGRTDLYKLGGMLKRFPITAFFMFIAVLGITGAPGLNGYTSKTLLHHAVSEAAHTHLPLMVCVEKLFLLVGVGTAASFAKLYYLIFLARPKEALPEGKKEAWPFKVALVALAVVMLIIGTQPHLFPNLFGVEAAQMAGFDSADTALALSGVHFWEAKGLIEMVITLILGMLVCWVGLTKGLFHIHPPVWLSLEGIATITCRRIGKIWNTGEKAACLLYDNVCKISYRGIKRVISVFQITDHSGGVFAGGKYISDISANVWLMMLTLVLLILGYVYLANSSGVPLS
jgi:hydrogenase-4 component B